MSGVASGVTRPAPTDPPEMISLVFAGRSGYRWNAIAIFVSGPWAMRMICPGVRLNQVVDYLYGITAVERDLRRRQDHTTQSILAMNQLRSDQLAGSGRAAPFATITSVRPARSTNLRAFSVSTSTGRFPATVVIASTFSSGDLNASSTAIASSIPGSTSRTIRRGNSIGGVVRVGDTPCASTVPAVKNSSAKKRMLISYDAPWSTLTRRVPRKLWIRLL